MRGEPQHEDIRARAEDALACAREDDAAHLRMLEADSLKRVVQLDIDSEVIGIELQLVPRAHTTVFVHAHGERGDRAIERKLPVPIAAWMSIEEHERVGARGWLRQGGICHA